MRIKNTIISRGRTLVYRIYDNGPDGAIDRYTVAFRGYRLSGYGMVYPYLSASDNPRHPQGFGQYGEANKFLKGRHLGKRVRFEGLPLEVQRFITDNI